MGPPTLRASKPPQLRRSPADNGVSFNNAPPENRRSFSGPSESLMQSDLPIDTLGRGIGQSQPLASSPPSATPHQHIVLSPFANRRLPELASFRKNSYPIRLGDASGIPLKLASFSQHPNPLRLQHLTSQIGFVREIAIFPQLASFRKIAPRWSWRHRPPTGGGLSVARRTFLFHPARATLILGTIAESMCWTWRRGCFSPP